MKKNFKKILALTLMVIMILPSFSLGFSFSQVINDGNKFISGGSGNQPISESQIVSVLNPIFSAMWAIAVVVLVIMTVVMGIQYVVSGGTSADDKAQLKKKLISLAVSAVVILFAPGIGRFVYGILDSIFK